MLGFIEFISANQAWRPVNAENFMFIHCLVIYSKKDRSKGCGSLLITEAEKEAKNAPSGYGVFNLLHDGKLLEDHYLSATRFKNILKKELKKTEECCPKCAEKFGHDFMVFFSKIKE